MDSEAKKAVYWKARKDSMTARGLVLDAESLAREAEEVARIAFYHWSYAVAAERAQAGLDEQGFKL